jgi:hypothetical protein
MKISNYMLKLPPLGPINSGKARESTSYRYARRLLARQIYRQQKRPGLFSKL